MIMIIMYSQNIHILDEEGGEKSRMHLNKMQIHVKYRKIGQQIDFISQNLCIVRHSCNSKTDLKKSRCI
jgi:hypothetical protein